MHSTFQLRLDSGKVIRLLILATRTPEEKAELTILHLDPVFSGKTQTSSLSLKIEVEGPLVPFEKVLVEE